MKQYEDYSRQSGIYSIPLNDTALENLAVLAKVWGFVKYYHPVFQDSVFSIDYELFELMPKVLSADYTMRNRILCDWIDSLGPFSTDEQQYRRLFSDTAVQRMVSYDWMNDSGRISNELSGKLNALIYAERDGSNIYAVVPEERGEKLFYDRFRNEKIYSQIAIPDCGYRLLALFRYWNMIEYYFPAKHLIQKDWDCVLRKYIPLFAKCNFMNEYPLVCYRLFSEIQDTHANSFLPYHIFGRKILPVRLQYVEGKWIIAKVMNGVNSDIQSGDEIISINGVSVDTLLVKIRSYTSNSNETAFIRDAAGYLTATSKDSALLGVVRNDSVRVCRVSSVHLNGPEVFQLQKSYPYSHPPYALLNDSTGYICIDKYVGEEMEKQVLNLLHQIKKVIIDVRYNTGKDFGVFIRKYLIYNHNSFIKGLSVIDVLPGIYRMEDGIDSSYYRSWKYKGKVVILVNEYTQSFSEQLVLLLQKQSDTRTIGANTAGAVGEVRFVTLPGGIKTVFTGVDIYTPTGLPVQRYGVPLDESINLTIGGILTGKDEIYDRALLW